MRKLAPLAMLMIAPRLAWAADEGAPLAVLVGGIVAVLAVCLALVFTRRALGLLVTAIAGAGASIYLTVQHYVANSGGHSICNVNATFNCDTVNTSTWSELAGVPIALFGLGFYAAMGYLAWRRMGVEKRGGAGVMAIGGLVGLATSVFLAYQSSLLGVWCLFCVSTYGANLLLAIGSALEAKDGGAFSGKELVTDGGAAVAMGLATFIVGVVVYQTQTQTGPTAAGGSAGGSGLAGLYEQPAGKIVLDGTEPVRGPAAAKYTLVEWADYECPHCGKTAPEMEKLVKENPDLKMLFKHYPISGICNQFVQGDRHLNACNAAAAAECARQQGKFYELSDAMFANQEYLAPSDIMFIAREKGLDVAALEACLAKPEAMDAVRADVAAGGTAQIEGTPSIFVHGLFGDQWVRVNGGRDQVNTILKAARAGTPLPPPAPPTPPQ